MCIVLIGIVLSMLVYKMSRVPVLDEEQLREIGVVVLPKPRELPEFSLSDHKGQPFSADEFVGRWNFVFFGFTHCPDICPTSMSVLAQAHRQLTEAFPKQTAEFRGMLVSVDPDRDDVATMAQYVTAFSPEFVGLTGSREDVAKLATAVNVAFGKVPDGQGGYTVDHSGNIVIINPYGHYHGFIKMPHNPDAVRDAFLTLQDGF